MFLKYVRERVRECYNAPTNNKDGGSCQGSQEETVRRLSLLKTPLPALMLPKMGQKGNPTEKRLPLEHTHTIEGNYFIC